MSIFGGNPGASSGGFTFGTPTSTQGAPVSSSTPLGGFSFGQKPATTTAASATPFAMGIQPQASTQGFPFASSTSTSAAAPGGFTFGSGGGGVMGGGTPATPAAPSTQPTASATTGPQVGGLAGFAMGKMPTVSTVTTAAATPAAAPTGLTLGGTTGGQTAATKPLGISVGTTQGTAPGLTLGAANTTTSTGLSLGTATSASGFQFGGAKTTTAAPTLGGLIAGTTTAATKPQTTTLSFPVAAASTAATSSAASTIATAVVPETKMSYQQLEESINKWMSELEKQEQDFLELATQVNAWDRLLVENGEKITTLNSDMERVKVDQQKLDHELDFIHSQQRELEELLVPLEKTVEQQPNINIQQHSALERENTYQLAENIDAQLKRMLSDLKEIIDHLNSSNTNQDQNDPIQQITKILNSHMDSLQWIDQNTTLLGRKVEEISKQMEIQRREQERNFRLVYN
ncbi:nuclear pore glycoprotein p62-like isoform X2 [Saccostrea echinata]|uniref:nuclear pore glycoprotein p62-like isoform X2 n=1 Tax=Saccostrea echinata TaxID=191078 RepID=UPI002A82AA22|nr:nuclear pore glycoprotein p62-like isoform X2 [Saccostrea echinata]